MAGRQSVSGADTARHFEQNPVLADFAKPFPALLGEQSDVGEGFQKLAAALSKSKRTGVIQFTISDGRKTRTWCLAMTPNGCDATETSTERPNLEILTDTKSWSDIAQGRLAPLEAFGRGKVRVRGDIELARVLARYGRR